MIVIVMGVSGSGKSYLAQHLAEVTGWPFAEGDDYHSEANKAKMAARIPLTDADRAPWLAALHQVMLAWHAAGSPGILTCSALKASYREELSAGLAEARFVWLDPPREVLLERLKHRPGHYMPPELLDSQLATLEPPTTALDQNVLRLDGSEPIGEAIRRILAWLAGPQASTESTTPSPSSNPLD
jgi:gluconokinase